MKICNKCKQDKNPNEFSKNKRLKDGLQSRCKLCERENNKILRERHPNSKYYNKNKEYYKNYIGNRNKQKYINCSI